MKTKLTALLAVIATASAEPVPNVDKLTTRATGMGKTKTVEITGKADAEPLTVIWGTGRDARMTIPAGDTKTRKIAVVDTETNTRKTGIVQDRKLR